MMGEFIIAGKEEGFHYRDARIVSHYGDPEVYIAGLKEEGYTQFILLKQTGYEYTLDDGEVIKGEV